MAKIFEPTSFFFKEREILEGVDWNIAGMEDLIQGLNFDTSSSILPVCEYFGKYLIIDKKWADTLNRYVYSFTTRSRGGVDYAKFFGSPYLGLEKITFTSQDRNEWFSEIFDVDEEELKENLHECKMVNSTWNVVGDVFNLTIPYLLFRITHSKLDPKVKHQAMVNVLCMYHYKCLTSMIHNDYPFPPKKEVVLETYNRLSMKYDIKRYGSWRALIVARAEFILDPKTGIHYDTFMKMNSDKAIIYMVGDIQDRLRGVINDINKVFHDVKNQVNIVRLEGNMVNLTDGVALKNVAKEVTQYRNYLEGVLTSKNGFFKEELIDYATRFVDGAPKDKLSYIVQNFPELYNAKKGEDYRKLIEETILHLFEYLHTNRINKTNIYQLILKMRGAYNAPRSVNESVMRIRILGDDMVRNQTGIKTPITVTSLRTAFLIYVVLRTLSRDYYQ